MKKIGIIIVDDHLLFSEGLDGLISDFKEFNVLAVLANGMAVVDYFSTDNQQPDIVLMDIQMPVMNGLEATKWMKTYHPHINVIGLSNECDEEIILKMLRAGANGYLGKVIHPSELEFALKEVYSKGFFYTENVSNTLLNSLEVKEHKEVVVLKAKELEFLKLACTEMTYKQIAETMYLSPKTIENYREALFDKLNVKSRIGLVLYAIKEKIVIL
ncbi:MAG: response regulator transcription factor [Lutibacter sp.]|nr:response regulator transcription factor [Lutibacter sp.]MDT8417178.1 response regulator transcription factor [Lutibacter sp.]